MKNRKFVKGTVFVSATLLFAAIAVPAQAATVSGYKTCPALRTVFTSSGSGIGTVAHSHSLNGTTWTKSWTNTSFTNRYYARGMSTAGWSIDAGNLSTYGATCET
jgi:hypothetical protein